MLQIMTKPTAEAAGKGTEKLRLTFSENTLRWRVERTRDSVKIVGGHQI